MFEIIESSYDSEMTTATIETRLGDDDVTFYVQLAGGEYLSKMGCWILTDGFDGDIYFNEDMPDYVTYKDQIIKAAECAYEEDKIEILGDVDNWEKVEESVGFNVSATSSVRLVIQKNLINGVHRVIPETCGFIQINDYACFPDFFIEEFIDIESAREFVKKYNREI